MSIDLAVQREIVSGIESCPAGAYCPAFEHGVLPSVGMGPMELDDDCDEFGVIVDQPTGDAELDDAIASFRQGQPAWIRRSIHRQSHRVAVKILN